MRILAVIPARGGSKGIPNKNLAIINDLSLVAITIKNALNSGCFTKVHVSTDSHSIRDEALKYQADCSYLRPAKLSRNNSKTNSAIEFCLQKEKQLGFQYDAICELQPTYVFRGKKMIKEAVSTFVKLKNKFNSLITLTEITNTSHPDYACQINHSMEVIYGKENPNYFNRQEISKYFSFHGMILISKVDYFLKNKSL